MNYRIRLAFVLFTLILIALKVNAVGLSVKSEIRGSIKDSLTREGLPFASVQVLASNDSSFVSGTMADADGKYMIDDIQYGEYIISASYMGYTENNKTLIVQSKKIQCDLHLIRKSISLTEISITADKKIVEHSINRTTVNVSKNMTVSAGSASDVLQTLPSIDIDIDGNISYRGSDKVMILLNGEKSELSKSLNQIPSDQIDRVELINNPSAKYDADGMSGIINIVLKSGKGGQNKTTLMINAGFPETLGGNAGYSGATEKTSFFVNGGMKHYSKYQIKEHLRENYENPDAYNYYQYDKQDQILNDVFINSNIQYSISKNQRIGASLIGSKKFNLAKRRIDYETRSKSEQMLAESLKELEIDLDNYAIEGSLNYSYMFNKGGRFSSKVHHSLFDQLQVMSNEYYPELSTVNPELQNTYSKQKNKQTDFSLDYLYPVNNSIDFETGYNFYSKDLMNDFNSESFNLPGEWISDPTLANKFLYKQVIHAVYFDINAKLKNFELQAGLRGELTENTQNDTTTAVNRNLFPSVNISRKLNDQFTIFVGSNRRINRPTIIMLNPFSGEYADIMNRHKGNPDLLAEYINSIEIGNRFVFKKLSGMVSIYYRDINQAISRVKSASDESALFVTYINLDKAKLAGSEISISYKPFEWWSVNSSNNIFHTSLSGEYKNNIVNNNKTGWTLNIANSFKLPNSFGFQLSGYYRSKLPSVMGTYKERYYMDLALNKKILRNKAQVVFKVTDVFNTYKFAFDLDAIDDNSFRYSQRNKRKNQSRYFVLSFIYNINGKDQKKNQKENFFLDDFEK